TDRPATDHSATDHAADTKKGDTLRQDAGVPDKRPIDMTPKDTAKTPDTLPPIDATPHGVKQFALTVNGSGTGSVTSDKGGIACTLQNGATSGTCSAMIPTGLTVTL